MSILAKMLERPGWLLSHVTSLQQAMRSRCAALLAAAEKHLAGVATWRPPHAGMFLWVELNAEREPAALLQVMLRTRQTLPTPASTPARRVAPTKPGRRRASVTWPPGVWQAMRELGVAVMSGENAAAEAPPAGRRHLRLTYVIDEDDYDAGVTKVRQLVERTDPGGAAP